MLGVFVLRFYKRSNFLYFLQVFGILLQEERRYLEEFFNFTDVFFIVHK